MSFNVCFDIAAFLILALTFFYFGSRRKAALSLYRIYYVAMLVMMAMTVLDLLTVAYRIWPDLAGREIGAIVNLFNAAMQFCIVTQYVLYLLANASLDEIRYHKWRRVILLSLVPFEGVILYHSVASYLAGHEGHVFRECAFLQWTLTGGLVLYFIGALIIAIYYRKNLGFKHATHMLGSFALLLLAEAFQIFHPDIRMISIIIALGLVDLNFSVQRPEEIFDSTDAMRRKYFRTGVMTDYAHGISFYVVFIRLHDYRMLVDSIGQEDTDGLLKSVTSFLVNLRMDALVYHDERDTLVLKVGKCSEEERARILHEIRERFKMPWRNGMMESMLTAHFMAAYCPEEIPDALQFRRMVSNLIRTEAEPDTVIPVQQLVQEDKEGQMLEAIRRALDNNSFEVYYQPIYSTKEQRIVAAEALIRLFDPEYGFIPPEPMIALAEREGYILRIGEIVFTEVCRFFTENHLDRLGVEYIEVNLSAVQCMQNRLAEEFLEIMRKFNLPAESINFEITETAAMISNATVIKNISHFELHGVSLSLDDYGTGYSNISYLYNLPFMLMKIDKSLLWSADENEKAEITLRNTFRMAQRLHMKVVMEGVETEAQIRKLLEMNCDYFQGYYFAKPAKGEDFINYVKNFRLPEVCVR